MDNRKMLVAVCSIFLAIIVTALLWKMTIFLSFVLIVLAYAKHIYAPIKKELLWFVITGILGTTTEGLIMWLGHNPWSYAMPSIFNIPFWLIPLWGLAGITLLTLHKEIMNLR